MQIRRRVLTVGATFFLAAATGHIMQNGDSIGARLRGSASTETIELAVTKPEVVQAERPAPAAPDAVGDALAALPAGAVATLPDLPDILAPTLAPGLRLAARVATLEQGYTRAPSAADLTYSPFGLVCEATGLALAAGPDATIAVTLKAPCHADERVTLRHAGLAATLKTDAGGQLTLSLPAMTAKAEVTVGFADGSLVRADVSLPDIATVDRMALTWRGNAKFDLAALGSDGQVTTLGDAALAGAHQLQILSRPHGSETQSRIEAAVSSAVCGREVRATVMQMAGGRTGTPVPLSIQLPGCAAAGEIVVMDFDRDMVPTTLAFAR